MRKALTGLGTLSGPCGELKERATFTCIHCNAIRHVKPFCDPADLGGVCRLCDNIICEECVGKPCDHFMKKIERQESAARSRRWISECL